MKDLQYDAFISYRHCPLDQFAAANLHRKLERFRLPKNLLQHFPESDGKIHRVFRDEDELPLASNLSDPIEKALASSKFLIVICTPRLKDSLWCQKEIETFLRMHGRKKILLVLAEGEPSESFPEILTYENIATTDASGNEVIKRKPLEPLAADIRGTNDKERLKAMDTAVMKLAAAMFGLNYDEVRQRNREQMLKQRIAVASWICSFLMLFLVVCLFLLAKISTQNAEIKEKYAGSMANAADELLGRGRRMDAMYAVRSVLDENGYANAESYKKLQETLQPYSLNAKYAGSRAYEIDDIVREFDVSPDGRFIALSGTNGDITVFDSQDTKSSHYLSHPIYSTDDPAVGRYINLSSANNDLPYYGFSGKSHILFSDGSSVYSADLNIGNEKKIFSSPGYILTPSDAANGRPDQIAAVITANAIYGVRGEDISYSIDLSELGIDIQRYSEYDYGYSENGQYLAVIMTKSTGEACLIALDALNGKIILSKKLNIPGHLSVTTDGQKAYIAKRPNAGTIENFSRSRSMLYTLDLKDSDAASYLELPILAARHVDLFRGSLLVTGRSSAVAIDPAKNSITAKLENSGIVIGNLQLSDKLLIADYDGHLHFLGENAPIGIDMSINLLSSVPKDKVLKAISAGGKLYYLFAKSNYIAEFELENKINPEKLIAGDNEFTKGEGLANVDISSFARNQSISDNDIQLSTEQEKMLIRTFMMLRPNAVLSVVYIKDLDMYALNDYGATYLLDHNFSCIAKLDPLIAYAKGAFFVKTNNHVYKIPYVSYKEMLQRADAQLGSYRPSGYIQLKYNMK